LNSNTLSLPLFRRGKVRDVYDLGDRFLFVATDRISAFDVVLPTPIPGKGAILTQISNFWFERFSEIENHVLESRFESFPPELQSEEWLKGRSVIVRKCKVIPVECVARGYLTGSGLKEYQKSGTVCGIRLEEGLVNGSRISAPIFTPSTKEDVGHDENISFQRMSGLVGKELASSLRDLTLRIYTAAAEYALTRGIIIADTKFEFGLLDGRVIWIDEALTPDSSRFWPVDGYRVGVNPPSFDKQFVRDWLEASGWNKEAPGPELPPDVVARTREKYLQAYRELTGREIDF
jgi:phosphoribosylaminoimidazole-succinocarboxamide synthase